MENKEFLVKANFKFDYGWRKEISLNICGKIYSIEVVISSFYEEDEIKTHQIDMYKGVKDISTTLNDNQNIITDKLYKEYGVINKELVEVLDVKQIIIPDEEDFDFGIYCESYIDLENGIGIKIKDKKIIELGLGDIVL